MLDEFERAHPGLRVESLVLPNASDVAHQYFLTALEGGSTDFDLLVADVVWIAELARAGWIAKLSDVAPAATLHAELIDGAVESVVVGGETWAIPWYVDVGLLYRRVDLVPEAPRTFDALDAAVRVARDRDPTLGGYVFQGRQYEGLVCNTYELAWGFGGETFRPGTGRLALDTAPMRRALERLRDMIERGTAPLATRSMAEEEARRAFQDGRAVFMRNWPYAWSEGEREGSKVRGKIAVSPLPTASGSPGFGALGGYHLAVNSHVPESRRRLASELALHLTSPASSIVLAEKYGRNPVRRSVLEGAALAAAAPAVAAMTPVLLRARARPVTPYYPMLTDALQGEMSAALTGIRAPAAAAARMQAFADRLMGTTP